MSEKYSQFTSLQKSISPLINFGTSSWTYTGWQSLVYYNQYKSDSALRRNSLAEYAQCPLFQTVGLDSTFYRPPAVSTLERYKEQVPETFTFLIKAWEGITAPKFSNLPRYGDKRGTRNESFLSLSAFEHFLEPFVKARFERHIGVFVFQFQTLYGDDLEGFLEKLHAFLQLLPSEFRFAIEIRNPMLLQKNYFDMLNSLSMTHCFNHWTEMPSLKEQMKAAAAAGGLSAPFFAARILTPQGVSYSDAVRRFSPYSELKAAIPEMRADVVRLAKRAIERNVPAYVVVNNRAEGCSPKTIDALRDMISQENQENSET